MTLSSKLALSLAALAAAGLMAPRPAAAQALLSAGGSVVYGSSTGSIFKPASGNNGLIEFATTPAAQTAGHFVGASPTFTEVTFADGTSSKTLMTQPSYISSFGGFNVEHAAGYGYPAIASGTQAGFVGFGAGDGGGNVFSFTVGTAKSFTFDVLANYSTNALENPGTLTLTGVGATPASVSLAGSGSTFATDYTFNISNAAAGETFTLSTDRGFIAGAAFGSPPAVPEASTTASLGLLLALGLGGVAVARRRKTAQDINLK